MIFFHQSGNIGTMSVDTRLHQLGPPESHQALQASKYPSSIVPTAIAGAARASLGFKSNRQQLSCETYLNFYHLAGCFSEIS